MILQYGMLQAKQRLAVQETDLLTWQHVFQVNFMAPVMLANGTSTFLQCVCNVKTPSVLLSSLGWVA